MDEGWITIAIRKEVYDKLLSRRHALESRTKKMQSMNAVIEEMLMELEKWSGKKRKEKN